MYIFWKRLDIKLDKRVKHKFSNILFIKWEIWLGKASFCDPNVFSSSYFPAIVICRLLFTKKMQAEFFFSFFVYSKCYYSISARLTVILTVENQTSECHLSKETNIMHIIQMAQEQHAIYMPFLGV